MTPELCELCEKRALHAVRMLRGNTHPATVAALRRLAEKYAVQAARLRCARTNGVKRSLKTIERIMEAIRAYDYEDDVRHLTQYCDDPFAPPDKFKKLVREQMDWWLAR